MHEKYWAKISPCASMFKKYEIVIYENISLDESSFLSQEVKSKKAFTAIGAKRWAERSMLSLVLSSPANFFIKETDIIRRNWND